MSIFLVFFFQLISLIDGPDPVSERFQKFAETKNSENNKFPTFLKAWILHPLFPTAHPEIWSLRILGRKDEKYGTGTYRKAFLLNRNKAKLFTEVVWWIHSKREVPCLRKRWTQIKVKSGVLCCAMSMAKTRKKELEQFFGPYEKSNTKTKPPRKR